MMHGNKINKLASKVYSDKYTELLDLQERNSSPGLISILKVLSSPLIRVHIESMIRRGIKEALEVQG